MSRFHIPAKPAPAPFSYPAAFRFTENGDYIKYGHAVFEGRSARGDDHWTAEIITQTWYQAETGQIPISGTDYGGKFAREGFDGIWLDKSEIVRPTRDGIHGRETISTTVDLERFLPALSFDTAGNLTSSPPPLVSLTLPVGCWEAARARWPQKVIAVRLALEPDAAKKAEELARAGVGVIHLYTNEIGLDTVGRALSDVLREVHTHGDAQDQVGQILKSSTLVIHGDVGQTFIYGAKGGEIYVRGSTAGRPLINAVGRPRAVINGTCLDYLAESFMAGDPLDGGGFVILNGISFDAHGCMVEFGTPYPGNNLFSLASGGAIYLRDPHHKVEDDQLNGGRYVPLSEADWELIEPYLIKNERLFDIPLEALLSVDGHRCIPREVYRKIEVLSRES